MKAPAKIAMIWAQSSNGIIGREGDMPWFVPEDFAHFKDKTMGSPVIMGRTTWDSLPHKSKPLPGRDNIVLTTQRDFAENGATVVHNIEDALHAAQQAAGTRESSTIWVIGGASIYNQFMVHAQLLEVTDINLDVEGDTRAPDIAEQFTAVSRTPESGWLTSRTEIDYAFTTYTREGDSAN